jgi:hypothetical protein
LSKKLDLDFSKPLSRVAFFSEENIFLKKLMTAVYLSFLDLLQGTKKIKAALDKSSFQMLYFKKITSCLRSHLLFLVTL